ncbi:MAG: dehydrogenase [Actinomycetia bacterium]|nr:dehydrogenase [Actinomycetes bacterium]
MPTDDQIRTALDSIVERRTVDTKLTTMGAGSDDLEPGHHWLAGAVDGGWAKPTWPTRHGGRDASPGEDAAIGRVMREYAIPDLYAFMIGLGMVGPALLAHGTDAQQDRWLRPIASGADIWCQMFSEPEAGSDLANVGLRAEADGDEWLLSGQKVWTSRAMWASWGIVLARTDPEAPKHKGLTMFAVPMGAPGVEVRPLAQMNGDEHFSEVFMEEARVPDSDRIGDVGEGWRVAMTILAHERAGGSRGGGDGKSKKSLVPRWLNDAADTGIDANPVWLDRAMAAHAFDQVASWTGQRAVAAATAGSPGPAGSGDKLRTVRTYKQRAWLVNEAQGPSGMLTDAHGYIEVMTAPSMSIRGGTDEIQRNIMGERVLGLPGEPRLDRDVPWKDSRKGLI